MKLATVCRAAVLLSLAASTSAYAQVNAVLGGTVSDSSGAAIPKVEIKATNISTGIVTTGTTNDAGSFQFPSLQPGTYTLTASISGFQTTTFNDVQLSQNQQVRQNFTLQVSAGAQTVEVVAQADTTLSTTGASVGNVLTSAQILNLPVQSRNVLDFTTTTAGVIKINGAFGAVPIFAGTQAGQVNTTRDGLTTNDGRYNDSNGAYSGVLMSPDMVEEVQVSVNTIDASLGRGSAQVQVRTRAGGNAFHGALFYTNSNSFLNANTWFNDRDGKPKDYQNRNQFGGRLGGPIKKNKAFFFVLIDNQRYLERQTVESVVLTPTARQGIFRYLTANSVGGTPRQNGSAVANANQRSVDSLGNPLAADPTTGTPLFLNSFNVFTDVHDPNRTKQDQIWIPQLLSRLPLPNDYTVGDGLNTAGFHWQRTHNGIDGATGLSANPNRNHLTSRFDYQVNDKNKVTFTLTREKDFGVTAQTGLPAYPAGFFGDVSRTPDFYTVGWSSTITSSILNEFRFGLKRDTWYGTSPLDQGCCVGAGQNDITQAALAARNTFPQVSGNFLYTTTSGLGLGTYADLNVSTPRLAKSPFKQFADTVSINHGKHSFQFGFEADFAHSDSANGGGTQTTRPFVTLGVGANNVAVPNITVPGIQSNDVTTAQSLLANLAGSIASIQEQFYVNSPSDKNWLDYRTAGYLFYRDFHQNDFAFYAKDNWKASRSLTLTLGLRYDKYGVPYESHGLGGRFSGGRSGVGGQAGLFGCSGNDFTAMFNPSIGCDPTKLTTTEFVGKDSPNPGTSIFQNDWNNFAPSVGFSWNVPGIRKATVIRGGFAFNYIGSVDYLAYNTNIGNLPGQTLNTTVNQLPGQAYLDLATLPASAIPLSTGTTLPFSAVPLNGSNRQSQSITGYADNRVTPYVESYNLSIQHQISRDLTFEVSYVGNQGHKLWNTIQINETNIFENGILDAFNVTRAGGDAPLFNQMLNGLNVTGAGVVNGTTLTGSQALRKSTTTNTFIANGDVGALANFLNTTANFTTLGNGGILRNAGLPENFIVANPQFFSVALNGNIGNSTYNALEAQITKRLSHGLSGQFSYTFSKTLGDSAIRDPRNRRLDKQLASIDRPHILKGYASWDVPTGRDPRLLGNSPAWVKQIVGGWQFGSSFSWASGSPLGFASQVSTISARSANTLDLVNLLPATFQQQVVANGNGTIQYFQGLTATAGTKPTFGGDPTLPTRFTNNVIVDSAGNIIFQNPQPGKTGNTAQNLPGFRGPGSLGLDVSLNKQVRLREGMNLSFRADAINFLNTPVWGNPSTNISNAGTFGQITTAGGSRTITLNVRLDF